MKNINIPTTGEPVTEQAPTMKINTDTVTVPTADTAASEIVTPGALPVGYLSGGYYATADSGAKYLRPEFVSTDAQQIATTLASMKPSDFTTLLRGLKSAKKRTLPFEARQTAAAELLPKALALVHRKKAPALLVNFIRANLDAIRTDEDWLAFYRHCDAINGLMMGGDT